jgi:hypothetical protein
MSSENKAKCLEVLTIGNKLFSDKAPLDSLHQEIAENFYVERATFTVTRSVGDEFADNLTSSYPLQARRDLGNLFGSMLRPRDKSWFKIVGDEGASMEALAWMEWSSKLMRNAMYDKDSGFVRATKEVDHDYAAFGQGAISCEMNWDNMSLLYRSHHLRDIAWAEGITGRIDRIDRKWKPTIRDLVRKFGEKNVHHKLLADYKKGGASMLREVECRHVIMPSDEYAASYRPEGGGKLKRFKQPWVSLYIDVENEHIIEEVGSWTRVYTIPRWQTVSDSQYSYSPAVTAALPDARLYQAISLTLLEAGEKYTNPPMVAVGEAIRGDLNLFAGGVTHVSDEYDERLGDVLRPISQQTGTIGIGYEMQGQIKQSIHEAFFLNRINLPDRGSAEMTAYETGQRVSEYIRDALPIFQPSEQDYNGDLCDITFDTLLHANAFGTPDQIPEELQGQDVDFSFESPLHAAEERLKGQKFMGALGLIGQAMGLDPSVANVMNIKTGLRDAIVGSDTPIAWMYTEEESAELDAQAAEAQEQQQMMDQLGQGAEIAKTAGEAGGALGLIEEA